MVKNKQLFLIFIPAIIVVSLALFIRVTQYQALNVGDTPIEDQTPESFTIPIFPGDPIIGDKKAARTIVAFEDFGCEGCLAQHTLFEQLLDEHPGAFKIIWKGLPVTRFPHNTRSTHEVAFCMNELDAFDDFASRAFANSTNLSQTILQAIIEDMDINTKRFDTCRSSGRALDHVTKVETLARVLNIQSVPAVFIDNKQIQSPTSVQGWEALLGL